MRDEVADAARQGKRLMLYFWLKSGFVPVAVNIRGDRDITWTDGQTMSEKQLALAAQVRGTPTMLFFDERGAIARRVSGYLSPAELARALD